MKERKEESKTSNGKLTPEEFILRAIEKLAKPGKNTIHVVWSGMNAAYRQYFPGGDPVAEVNRLANERKISFRLARGGAVIGPPGAIQSVADAKSTLDKMGIL